MKNYTILLIFILVSISLNAQTLFSENLGISAKTKGGILLAHRPVMAHLVQGHAIAAELGLNLRTDGDRAWEQKLNYPTYGFSFFASSTGNKAVIGNAFSLYSFIDIPIVRVKKFSLSTKLGGGLGYVTKPFNQIKNPKNVAIGSAFNGFIQLGAFLNYENSSNTFSIGLDMSHFSNGSSKLPNLGLNLPYLSLGYVHHLEPLKIVQEKLEYNFSKEITIEILGIVSPKQVFPTGGRTAPVFALASFFQKRITPISGVEVGLDLISNQSHFNVYKEIEKTQWMVLQVGVYAGYLFHVTDELRFYTGMGGYVKNELDPAGYFYHRLGVRYRTKKRLIFQFGIKSNFAKADYFEYGIGYRIR